MLGYSCALNGKHADAAGSSRWRCRCRNAKATSGVWCARTTVSRWHWSGSATTRRHSAHAQEALRVVRSLGDQLGEGRELNTVGWYEARLGDYERARATCRAALRLNVANADQDGEADTADTLGFIAFRGGRIEEARGYYERAIVHFRAIGHTHYQADIHAHLGEIHRALGQIEQARAAFEQSRELYRTNRRGADVDRIQRELNGLDGHQSMQLAT